MLDVTHLQFENVVQVQTGQFHTHDSQFWTTLFYLLHNH